MEVGAEDLEAVGVNLRPKLFRCQAAGSGRLDERDAIRLHEVEATGDVGIESFVKADKLEAERGIDLQGERGAGGKEDGGQQF